VANVLITLAKDLISLILEMGILKLYVLIAIQLIMYLL
jgi:hypothetical protein